MEVDGVDEDMEVCKVASGSDDPEGRGKFAASDMEEEDVGGSVLADSAVVVEAANGVRVVI